MHTPALDGTIACVRASETAGTHGVPTPAAEGKAESGKFLI
jgi:hypothetical protein